MTTGFKHDSHQQYFKKYTQTSFEHIILKSCPLNTRKKGLNYDGFFWGENNILGHFYVRNPPYVGQISEPCMSFKGF